MFIWGIKRIVLQVTIIKNILLKALNLSFLPYEIEKKQFTHQDCGKLFLKVFFCTEGAATQQQKPEK